MKPLKAAFLSVALMTSSLSGVAMADTTADPTQVSTLVTDIETAINGAIGKDGFSAAVTEAALQVVQTAEASGSNASIAVATLETANGGAGGTPQAGGVGGGAPIGAPTSGSGSGSGYP